MKKFLVTLSIGLQALICTAQITVNVPTAGGFSTALAAAGGDPSTVTNLIVTGTIDARDIKFMNKSMRMLAVLDLTDVSISAYTGTGGTYSGDNSSIFYPANEMPEYSFYPGKSSLTSIKLPNSITSIGDVAFYGCAKLSCNLVIPNSVTSIKSYAFYRCYGLTGDLIIPNSVTHIGNSAFDNCFRFTGSLNISNSVTSIGKNAFYGCTGFTGDLIIPNSVTFIADGAFCACTGFNGKLILPNSITSIGYYAFQNCQGFKGNLIIPNSVTSIGMEAFRDCSGFTGNLIIPNFVTQILYRTFYGCNGFTSLTIPSSVSSVDGWAFFGCSSLQKIIVAKLLPIPIYENTFYGVNKTACELVVPIGSKAAYQSENYWKDFNNITEANHVTYNSMGGSLISDTLVSSNASLVAPIAPTKRACTFAGWYKDAVCTNEWDFTSDVVTANTTLFAKWTILSPIIVNVPNAGGFSAALKTAGGDPNTVSNLILTGYIDARDIFFMRDSMPILTTLDLELVQIQAYDIYPANEMPQYSFYSQERGGGKKSLIYIKLPNSITAIGDDAFLYCSGLTGNLIIPNSVASIGKGAFNGCTGFTGNLIIPNSVTSIGKGAFNGCNGFTGNLIIPNSVASIGDRAFQFCIGFTGDLIIPNSVTYVGEGTFQYCSGLTGNLIIPNSVTSIGRSAFEFCSRLTGDLIIPVSVDSIGDFAFGYCIRLTGNLIIPNSVTNIGSSAFRNCSGFRGNLIIPNSVTSIGDYAFSNCSGFTGDLIIPNSVVFIRDYAFSGCYGFTGNLIIPNSVTSIGNRAFYDCSGLTGDLIIPNLVVSIGDYAYYNCSGLTGLTIPRSVLNISLESFSNCKGLQKITVANVQPTQIAYNTFKGVDKTTCELIVPRNSGIAYRSALYWRDFTRISEAIFVYFNTQGGSAIVDTIVNYNTSIVSPTSPTKTGFTFSGWYKDATCNNPWDFAHDMVTTNTTLYAKWTILPPIIVYVPASGGFSAALVAAGGNPDKVINLAVTGYIDARDIKYMRDNMPVLASLDLEDIHITAYNGPGGTYGYNNSSIFYPANEMPNYSFYTEQDGGKKSLGYIQLPISITSIGDYAFRDCRGLIGNLLIPDSVTSIGDGAFYDCIGFTGDLIIPNSVINIGIYAFLNCSGFGGNLIISNSVSAIGHIAFSGCTGFTGNLKIPNSVTSIGNSAFGNCTGFTGDLIIPNSVTSIGNDAFSGCSGFSGSLIISNAVTSIGNNAFLECRGFKGDLIIPNSVTNIGKSAFRNCSGFRGNLIISNSATSIGATAFQLCSGLTGNLIIPNSVTDIGNNAFYGCTGFRGNLIISNSVTSIGNNAFYGCTGFTGNLIIPNSIDSIGSSAFANCSGFIGNLNIPSSVTYIGESAFENCSGFTGNLILPNSKWSYIFSGWGYTFSGCSGITNLIIPSSVFSILNYSFANCKSLQKIVVAQVRPPYIYQNTFLNVNKTTCELVVPIGSKAAYQSAIYWRDFIIISEAIFVTYNSQGGSAIADTIVYYNTSISTPNAPTKAGYFLTGWYKEAECINAWNFVTDKVTTNTTLYAKWVKMMLVSFNTQGGSAIADTMVIPNANITSPTTPTKKDYTFSGWYKDATCNNPWDFASDLVTTDTTLYAKWTISTNSIYTQNRLDLSLFPNPAVDFVKIEGEKVQTVAVLDLLGIIQLQFYPKGEESIYFDVSSLKPGCYLILVKTSDGEVHVMKLLIKK